MAYILIVYLYAGGSYGSGPALMSAEFGSLTACKSAYEQVKKMDRHLTVSMSGVCVQKGGAQ